LQDVLYLLAHHFLAIGFPNTMAEKWAANIKCFFHYKNRTLTRSGQLEVASTQAGCLGYGLNATLAERVRKAAIMLDLARNITCVPPPYATRID
jgi:hypothetical protein